MIQRAQQILNSTYSAFLYTVNVDSQDLMRRAEQNFGTWDAAALWDIRTLRLFPARICYITLLIRLWVPTAENPTEYNNEMATNASAATCSSSVHHLKGEMKVLHRSSCYS